MSEIKQPRKRYGVLVRTQLQQDELAELSRRAKQDGRSRSSYVTRLLQQSIREPASDQRPS